MVFALRLPLFAIFVLFVIVLAFPVTFGLYTRSLGNEKLPILAIVSLYLVLGIGADAVFIFTNTYMLAESSRRPTKQPPAGEGAQPPAGKGAQTAAGEPHIE